jgi:hypothetical protein
LIQELRIRIEGEEGIYVLNLNFFQRES